MTVNVSANPLVSINSLHALQINGISLGSSSETLTLNTVGSQYQITLNGQVDLVNTGGLTGVTVTSASGPASIDIENTIAGEPVSLSLGSGTDVVNISGTAHNLNNIAGPVTVIGGTGAETLNLDDQADTATTTYNLAGSTVQRTGLALIGFTGKVATVLNGGTGADTYNLGTTATGALPTLTPASGSSLTVNTGAPRPIRSTSLTATPSIPRTPSSRACSPCRASRSTATPPTGSPSMRAGSTMWASPAGAIVHDRARRRHDRHRRIEDHRDTVGLLRIHNHP